MSQISKRISWKLYDAWVVHGLSLLVLMHVVEHPHVITVQGRWRLSSFGEAKSMPNCGTPDSQQTLHTNSNSLFYICGLVPQKKTSFDERERTLTFPSRLIDDFSSVIRCWCRTDSPYHCMSKYKCFGAHCSVDTVGYETTQHKFYTFTTVDQASSPPTLMSGI